MAAPGRRIPRERDRCRNGHAYVGDSYHRRQSDNTRVCHICRNAWWERVADRYSLRDAKGRKRAAHLVRPPQSEEQRLWGRALRAANGCLEFPVPYGPVIRSDGSQIRAHRLAWVLTNGPIPDGLLVLHHCDNRKCIEPTHLFLGTQLDNMRDCFDKGRGRPGHKLSDEDVARLRSDYQEGMTGMELAEKYGVHVNWVYAIVNGRARTQPFGNRRAEWLRQIKEARP